MLVINPFKISKEDLPGPEVDVLKSLINETFEEINSIINNIQHIMKQRQFLYFETLLIDSFKINSEILMSISKLGDIFFNETMILMRTFLEILVDFLWIYSIFNKDSKLGEELAKRFYQIGANVFLEFSENFNEIAKNDPFLKNVKINFINQIRQAKKLKLIQIYNKKAPKNLRHLQKKDWRAHPSFKRNEIKFDQRSKVASSVAKELFNLKYAPYENNWKLLNQFTHWTSFHYKYLDYEVSKIFYRRNLNIYLGFIHDMITVMCKYFKLPITKRIISIRNQFIYFST